MIIEFYLLMKVVGGIIAVTILVKARIRIKLNP